MSIILLFLILFFHFLKGTNEFLEKVGVGEKKNSFFYSLTNLLITSPHIESQKRVIFILIKLLIIVYIESVDYESLKIVLGREDADYLDRLSRCPFNQEFEVDILHKVLYYKSELIGQSFIK